MKFPKEVKSIPSMEESNNEAWRELRRRSIGGSDAAAICGLSQWSSPYSVWADKLGKLPEKPMSEAMRLGHDLEDYVAQRWVEATGKKVHRVKRVLYNERYPFAHANIDRAVVGENAGLECKTTAYLDLEQNDDGSYVFPARYYVQCVHYLAVTGCDRWHLAVYVFGKGFFHWTLERDEAEISALMAQEEQFWECVKNNTPPAVDGSEATSDALTAIFAEGNGESIDLFGRDDLFVQRDALQKQKKELQEQIDEIDNTLKSDMGEAEKASAAGWSVSWKSQSRTKFDKAALAADYPDIDLSAYTTESSSRVFRVSKRKNA